MMTKLKYNSNNNCSSHCNYFFISIIQFINSKRYNPVKVLNEVNDIL